MGKYEPPRVRKGCKVTLRNTDTGDIVTYNLISSLFDSSRWWESPKERVGGFENGLSIKSHLGSELLGKQVGDIVGKYEIKDIEAEDEFIVNTDDSEERTLGAKQENMNLLLEKLESGEWLNAHFMELSPLREITKPSKTVIIPHYTSLNSKEFLDSIWLTNKEQSKKKGLYKAYINICFEGADAIAEMILSEEAIKKLVSKGAAPSNALWNDSVYTYSSRNVRPGSEALNSMEVKVDKGGHFTCRVTPDSKLDIYYMAPTEESEDDMDVDL